jgi:hypothetical protein
MKSINHQFLEILPHYVDVIDMAVDGRFICRIRMADDQMHF